MRFVLTPDWEQGIKDLADRLQRELQSGQEVLWLVSGGSNTAASVKVMHLLPGNLTSHLSVSLVDERFGPVGHEHSNWTKLLAANFEPKEAKLMPVLLEGNSFEEAQTYFATLITDAINGGHPIIAQLGIGDDGHIAGILPNSPATVKNESMVVGYPSDPYARLTISFEALKRLTAGYAFVFGSSKRQALETLATEELPLAKQPSQILKQMPESYVYNDQVGG